MANHTKPATQDKIRRAGRNDSSRIAARRATRGAPKDERPASTPASPAVGVAISRRNGATARRDPNVGKSPASEHCTVGLDLGDRASAFCVLDDRGDVISEGMLRTAKAALDHYFQALPPARVALEAGTHSGWISRLKSSTYT